MLHVALPLHGEPRQARPGSWGLTVASPDYLAITVEDHGPKRVLRLQGELDLTGTAALRAAIGRALEEHSSIVVLDLSTLAFIDCSGLSVLLWAHEQLAGRGGELHLVGSQPAVLRLLEVTGSAGCLGLGTPPG
jgi:anti-anti-sigma factor